MVSWKVYSVASAFMLIAALFMLLAREYLTASAMSAASALAGDCARMRKKLPEGG